MITPTREYPIADNQVDGRTRVLLMAIRQALLIALGALEDYLCIERSVLPKHKR